MDGGFGIASAIVRKDWGGGINNSDIAYNTITNCKDDAIQMEGDDVNLRNLRKTISTRIMGIPTSPWLPI